MYDNITLLYNRTELKLLCEDIQLGAPFEENWCSPRTFSTLMSQNSNFEDLDEDKTDLLLKFSPNSSLDTSQGLSQLTSEMEKNICNSTDQTSQSDKAKSILITQKPSLWQQNSTSSVNYSSKALLKDKGYLLNTELAISKTIRNYNNKRHHSLSAKRPHHLQDTKTSARPHTSVYHKKSSASHKAAKVRPFSALPTTSTDTAKDLELLTKSICRHLSIKDNLQ